MSLKNKAVTGVIWTSINQFGQMFIQFFVGLVLARLLRPEDYGLMAMTTVMIAFSAVISEGGIGLAIVQRKNLDDDDCSTAFWLNAGASLGMYGIMFLCAPLLAQFYNEPSLTLLLRVAGLRVLLGGLCTCHFARLERDMAFRQATIVQLPSFVIGAVLAIWMAYTGWGVWALVALSLFTGLAGTIASWLVSGWIPRWRFRRSSMREMIGFGLNMTGERLLETIFTNIYVLVIGKYFSPLQVGYYNRAQQFQNLPSTAINSVFIRVLMPMFSTIQADREKLRAGFMQSLTLATMASFPIFAGMAAVAQPMVVCLIGQKWEPCVPYLQILCFMGAFIPIHALNVTAILSQGRSGLSFHISIYKKLLVIVAIVFTVGHGIIPMLWGQLVVAILSMFINIWPNRSLLGISMREQIAVFTPYLVLSMAMGFGVWWLTLALPLPAAGQLAAGVLAGAVIYGLGLRFIHRPAHKQIADLMERLPGIGPVARFVLT
ncbi:MAG: lipopolysaccharide biosynthesis protein [Armatimonadetes bacterium]|nr:lipopolysaccharide biosynthesis protein [Akkermansiaceae bacterium]